MAWGGAPAGEAGGRRKKRRIADAITGFEALGRRCRGLRHRQQERHPEFPLQVLRDEEEIAAYLGDVCAQESTHRVEVEVVSPEREAFT